MSYEKLTPLTESDAFTEPDREEVRRRTILKAFGAAGASAIGLHTADQVVTTSKFNHTTTDLNVYETKSNKKNGDLTVVLPGLGVQNSYGTMHALMPTLKEWSQFAASVRLADTGFEIDDIADQINRAHFKLGFKAVHLYGHSMGGTYIPDITERLDTGVRRGLFAYNCTPWTPDYIYDEELVKFINMLPIKGSYGTKFVTQLSDRFFREQVEDLSFTEKLGVAWDMTNDEGSPQTWLDQLEYLGQRSEKDYGRIPEDTKSIYIAPRNFSTDHTVQLDAAIKTFRDKIPGDKQVLRVRADGHANPKQRPGEYNEALRYYAVRYPLVFSSTDTVTIRHRQQIHHLDT